MNAGTSFSGICSLVCSLVSLNCYYDLFIVRRSKYQLSAFL